MTPSAPPSSRASALQHLPVGMFAVVMGVGGAALAWGRAEAAWGWPTGTSTALAWLSFVLLEVLLAGYLVKAALFKADVVAEWRNPVRSAFAAAIPTGALISGIALQPHATVLAETLWWLGAAAMVVITLNAVRTWIANPDLQHQHLHPAWFIPVVANIVVPLGAPESLPDSVSWYFFGVGLIYWIALLPIVLHRLFFFGPLPTKLAPTLAILIAPPSVTALAWVHLGGTLTDPFTQILSGVALFQVLLLGTQARSLTKVPFAVSSWAYTFPLTAAATLMLTHAGAQHGWVYDAIGGVLLAVSTAVVLAVLVRTGFGIARGEILRPEG